MKTLNNTTHLKYLEDTFCVSTLAQVIEIGCDDSGNYLILDRTIHYPGGGGQPPDRTYLQYRNDYFSMVYKCDFNGGHIKHYVESLPADLTISDTIALQVDKSTRMIHSAYHTAGHWLASIVTENLELPIEPTKGYHYTDGAYVEFEGNIDILPESLLDQITMASKIDIQSQLNISSSIISKKEFEERRRSILAPPKFIPKIDRDLRLVTLESYRSVPCGGTHLSSITELKSFMPKKVYVKNRKIRISYEVSMPTICPPC